MSARDVFDLMGSIRPVLEPLLAALPRLGTAMLVMPFLPQQVVGMQVRAAFVVALALFLWPTLSAAHPEMPWTLGTVLLFIVKESMLGALIGYAAGLVIWAMASMGELIDTQAGFNNAQIFDPFGGHSGGPLAALMSQFGVLMFVSLGGLQVFLQVTYESYVLWPPFSLFPTFGPQAPALLAQSSGTLLELAVRWALPVIGVLLVIELGIGLINRAAPQLNAFYFSMPIKGVATALMLALMAAHLVDVARDAVRAPIHTVPALERLWKGV